MTKQTDDNEVLRISHEEMQGTLAIARAVEAARRRGGDSRERIAQTLAVFAASLVDGDPDGARALTKTMRELTEQLDEYVQ